MYVMQRYIYSPLCENMLYFVCEPSTSGEDKLSKHSSLNNKTGEHILSEQELNYLCMSTKQESGYGMLDDVLWYDEEEVELITTIREG